MLIRGQFDFKENHVVYFDSHLGNEGGDRGMCHIDDKDRGDGSITRPMRSEAALKKDETIIFPTSMVALWSISLNG